MVSDVDYGPMFRDYKVKYGNELEFIGSSLYDTVTLTAATDTQVTLFDQKRANRSLSNLPLAGTLPDPQGFLILSIRFYPYFVPFSTARGASGALQTGVTRDMALLLNQGVLLLKLMNKEYGQWPLWMLPAGGGPVPFMAVEGATADPGGVIDYATNGIADARNAYVLQEPLFIPPVTEIGVQLLWPALTGITTIPAIQLKVLFDGMMVRPVQ